MDEKLLKVSEVMQRLNVSRRTVYYWIQEGILPSVQIGGLHRFRKADIDHLIQFGSNASPGRRRKILAIDDDILVRESIKAFLGRAGYSVTAVQDGQSAVALCQNEDFDLTLTDMRMPGMSGLETLKAIRYVRQQAGKDIKPEIIMTAYEDQNARAEAEALGVRKFVTKPFDIDVFLEIIQKNIV